MNKPQTAVNPSIILKHPNGYVLETLHTYAEELKVDKEHLEESEHEPISTLRVVQFLLKQLGEVSTVHAASIFIDDVQSTRKLDYECDNDLGECANHIWWNMKYCPAE